MADFTFGAKSDPKGQKEIQISRDTNRRVLLTAFQSSVNRELLFLSHEITQILMKICDDFHANLCTNVRVNF